MGHPHLTGAGRQVLRDFPSATPPLEWLLTLCPRLQPRLFSIASAQALHQDRCQLTVAVVSWKARARAGARGCAAVSALAREYTDMCACVVTTPCDTGGKRAPSPGSRLVSPSCPRLSEHSTVKQPAGRHG